ncbi:MAG: thermonuclease family protein [Candidatus Poribacteria bacterium]|nr:thermonuclease family protein [Candidatus Poribacteria bacterium]
MSTYLAYVTRVIDGDTFKTSNRTIRLAGVDAPENNTPQGQSATAYLKHLIEGRQVTIKTVTTDVYGRSVADVWRYADRLYINQAMIDSGHAKPA